MILYVLNRFKIVSGWSQMFWMVIKRYQYFQMSLNTPDISKWFQMFQFQNYQEIFRWFQVSRIFRDFFQSFLGFFEITRGTGLYQNFGHERFLNYIFGNIRKDNIFFAQDQWLLYSFVVRPHVAHFLTESCCVTGKVLGFWHLARGSEYFIGPQAFCGSSQLQYFRKQLLLKPVPSSVQQWRPGPNMKGSQLAQSFFFELWC